MRLSRDAVPPVLIATTVQVVVALAMASVQVSAPTIARSLDIAVGWIGPFVALCYAVAMPVSLLSGSFVLRHGAVRGGQVCLAAAGSAALLFATGSPPAMLASALGYGVALGLSVPACSQMIARHAASRELPLAMSLGQSGMTIGRLVSGLVVPTLVLMGGWTGMLTAWAALAAALALVLERWRPRLDPSTPKFHKVARRRLVEPLALIRDNPELRRLTFAAVVFASAQLSLVVYLVAYMHEVAGLSLVIAGLGFATAQTAGIANRFLLGGIATASGKPRLVLSLLGFGMAAGLTGAAMLSPGWTTAMVLLGAAVLGSVAMSWNGLLFAEVVKAAGVRHAATATGAVSFVTFIGLATGPGTFGLLLALGHDYATGFLVFAALVTVASAVVMPRPHVASEAA